MDHIGVYNSLLIPGVVAIVLLIVLAKVVSAIVKLVTMAVIVAMLIGGFLMFGRINALQSAAAAAAHAGGQVTSSVAMANAVTRSARRTAAALGLNPAYLHVRLHCETAPPQVRLRYADDRFMFGLLSHQVFIVPLAPNLRC